MNNTDNFSRETYGTFNKRKIDLVISKTTDNVKWTNGMDGSFVYGDKK